MRAHLEVWGGGPPQLAALEADRTSVGRAASNDVVLPDPTVSLLHGVVERYPTGFCIKDLGSSNGTFVNGERVLGERRLRSGDEIRLGETRVVFRSEGGSAEAQSTAAVEGPPVLTRREIDVLTALCRPMAAADVFTQPATVKQLAEDLVVSEAAVKFHLANLYEKFGLYEAGESRRVRLANEAIRRRAVSLADLRKQS